MKLKFINNVQSSLLLLPIVLFAIASIGLLFVFQLEYKRLENLANEERNRLKSTFDKILQLNTTELSDLIFYEYAQWDETVEFVKNRNNEFIKVNIDWLVEENKFDGVLILDINTNNIYSNVNDRIKDIPFNKKELPYILNEPKELFFYTGSKNEIIEVYASTINRSSDYYKNGEIFGYFVAMRTWSDSLITSMENLTNSSIEICSHEIQNTNEDSKIFDGVIKFSRIFSDYTDASFARVDVFVKSNFLINFWNSSTTLLYIIGIFAIFFLLVLAIAVNKVVSVPLKKIIAALDTGKTADIKVTRKTSNEFGKIADLIDKFFTQKDELNRLISLKNSAEEDERLRISRELHDGIGQMLMSTKLKLQSAKRDKRGENSLFTEVSDSLNDIGSELNNITHALHPVDLQRYGLEKSVGNLCENFSKLLRFQISFNTYDLVERINYNIELALYRIIQECLNNIYQHAKANEVSVEIYRRSKSVYLTVTDNGIGFSQEDTRLKQRSTSGNGLINIKYRAELLGGKLNIESSKSNGTEIHIEIPIED